MVWLIMLAIEVALFFVTGLPEILRPIATTPSDLLGISWAAAVLSGLLILPIALATAGLEAMARKRGRPFAPNLALALVVTAALLWANAEAWSARVWYFRFTPVVFVGAAWLAFAWRRRRKLQLLLGLAVATALVAGTAANKLVYPDQYVGQHLGLVLLTWFSVRLFFDTPARRRAELAGNLALAVAIIAFVALGRGGLSSTQTERLFELPSARASWSAAVQHLDDGDGDGFGSFLRRADCDDSDASVNPLATEIPGDGRDNDCMGGDAPRLAPRARALTPLPSSYDTVVLLTIDALRADRLEPRVMPFLNARRADCAVYDNAYASYASTIFSVYALLHSRMPSTAGVIERCGYLYIAREEVGRETANLSMELKALGFQTSAVATVDFIRDCNDNRGFDQVWGPLPLGGAEEASELTLARAKETVNAWPKDGSRQFLWVHFFDPHFAYVPRDNPGLAVGSSDVERAYNSEVYAVDAAVRELWQALAGRKVLWLITADHGEEVGHGHLGLTAQELHVPLMLCGEGVTPGTRTEFVSHLDVAPTLLHGAGGRELPASFQGESLLGPTKRRGYAVAEFLGTGDRFHRVLYQPAGVMRVDHGLGLVTHPGEGSEAMYQSFLDRVISGP